MTGQPFIKVGGAYFYANFMLCPKNVDPLDPQGSILSHLKCTPVVLNKASVVFL